MSVWQSSTFVSLCKMLEKVWVIFPFRGGEERKCFDWRSLLSRLKIRLLLILVKILPNCHVLLDSLKRRSLSRCTSGHGLPIKRMIISFTHARRDTYNDTDNDFSPAAADNQRNTTQLLFIREPDQLLNQRMTVHARRCQSLDKKIRAHTCQSLKGASFVSLTAREGKG